MLCAAISWIVAIHCESVSKPTFGRLSILVTTMLHPRTFQNNRFLYRWVNRRKGDEGDGAEQVQSSVFGAPERGERERVSAAGPTITFGRSRCSRSMAASAMRRAIG